MKRIIGLGATMAIVAVSSLLVGCDRTVSRTEETTVRSDGTAKSKETTVKENSDGTVTKTEETKKTSPNP
jgi:type 1 fimbria pilin